MIFKQKAAHSLGSLLSDSIINVGYGFAIFGSPTQHLSLHLLFLKTKTIGALFHRGIALMGAHLDLRQRAVVFALAMMGTLADGTGNGLVGIMTVHAFILLYFGEASICRSKEFMQFEKSFLSAWSLL